MTLDTGDLSLEQLNAMLLAIPMDLTFTDENDITRYYSEREDLIFSRDPDLIGTDVRDCHSDKSLPGVEQMLGDLKSGKHDYFEAWRDNHNGRFIHTRYIAARDSSGKFVGCLETTQDVTEIRGLAGNKDAL
ncbi:MAG TPA: hypothetical protein ENH10_10955 [Bacteroidetes bacterium]|nr:hypothetical protein BMS3Bbin04_00504 [bacterium BMS3Bbin04]HDO66525.1 hypothetical protein [Bacteroidota bacterium]HEX05650.1 hypothetical protein [Bacteroidota bacterium]